MLPTIIKEIATTAMMLFINLPIKSHISAKFLLFNINRAHLMNMINFDKFVELWLNRKLTKW